MKAHIGLVLGLAAATLPNVAAAETITVEGIYPAGNTDAALYEVIAIERFGGADGSALSTRISDRLRSVRIDGAPWVRVVSGSIGSEADAALSGFVSTNVRETQSYDKEVETCVARDAKRKCVEKRKEKVPCVSVEVRVSPSLRLVDRDGRLIHSDDADVTRSFRACADEREPSVDPLIDQALDQIADRMRNALAPQYRREGIRVMETRKGMEKDAGRAFRDAIRQTKKDEQGACESFASLEPAVGDHPSLLFNIGLCAEAAGDFETAVRYYDRTLALDSGSSYANDGLRRIGQRRLADDQLEMRLSD